MELRATGWRVEPLAVDLVESSYFDDPTRFPAGSIAFDSGLLMRSVPHEWRARGRLIARQRHPVLRGIGALLQFESASPIPPGPPAL